MGKEWESWNFTIVIGNVHKREVAPNKSEFRNLLVMLPHPSRATTNFVTNFCVLRPSSRIFTTIRNSSFSFSYSYYCSSSQSASFYFFSWASLLLFHLFYIISSVFLQPLSIVLLPLLQISSVMRCRRVQDISLLWLWCYLVTLTTSQRLYDTRKRNQKHHRIILPGTFRLLLLLSPGNREHRIVPWYDVWLLKDEYTVHILAMIIASVIQPRKTWGELSVHSLGSIMSKSFCDTLSASQRSCIIL